MPTAGKLSEAEFTKQVLELAIYCGWDAVHFKKSRQKCPVCQGKGDEFGIVKCKRCDGSGLIWFTAMQGRGRGWPDIVAVRSGRAVIAELKMPGNMPTPEQEGWLAAWEKVPGAETYVWRPEDWPTIEETLR